MLDLIPVDRAQVYFNYRSCGQTSTSVECVINIILTRVLFFQKPSHASLICSSDDSGGKFNWSHNQEPKVVLEPVKIDINVSIAGLYVN